MSYHRDIGIPMIIGALFIIARKQSQSVDESIVKMHKIYKMKYYPVVKKNHEICREMKLESILLRRCLKLAEEPPVFSLI